MKAALYNLLVAKWPRFAWLVACQRMFDAANAQKGDAPHGHMSKHLLCIPPAHALCLVNPCGPVYPFMRVYAVIRPVADFKTEIAEEDSGRLFFFTTEAAAEQEVERRGLGWSSYEFWVEPPPQEG